MLKTKLITVAILALSQGVLAAQPPSAGSQIQQIPPSPVQQTPAPEIRIEQRETPADTAPDTVKVLVNALHVTGQTAYSEAELIAVANFVPGSELTLTDLRGMSQKIGDHYRRNGYFVAQAYLPVQDIKDGVVTIAVSEGKYGTVSVRNQTNLSDGIPNGILAGLNSGDVITNRPLERRLLLLSEIPGVNVKSTLVPGASVGASDLIVDVTPGQRVSGSVDADNAGNRYTGENRIGATVNFNDPTGRGDVATLRGMTSGSGLDYLRGSYQMPFGKATGGVAYTHMDYRLGKEFADLQAHGTADIASIYGSYPLFRTRRNDVNARLAFDAKTFQDKIDSTSSVTDKKAQVLMASLQGDHHDEFGGGGLNSYFLTLTGGNIDIQTPTALAADQATARSNGHFSKVSFNASRLQNLTQATSFYISLNGQAASKNLDVSEKMELGGMNAVRAYPEGEAFADEGYVLSLEARMRLPRFTANMPGQMQLIGFVDGGHVTMHKNPWTVGENSRNLSGAGIGLTWMEYNNFMVRAYYAHKLGNTAATSAPDRSGRFWIQLVKYF
ncbi:MAG: ShlB/FhaC/HecB family hemolysin secretion/activation protein [Proteobacteria bacterium]|nr:ShlB/FhaC/HecB family hemolysin secretion/activation protein [Pseudomonadota bacterium]